MFDALGHLRKGVRTLLNDVAQELGSSASASRIKGYQERLGQLGYRIVVFGHMKRGKSTLINALLGRANDDIAPIDVRVCQSAIVEYRDRGAAGSIDRDKAFVFFSSQEMPQEIELAEVRQYATEEANPGNRKGVRRIEVFGDFPLLNESVALVDTPGRGSIQKVHETLVEEFLPQADAIILPFASNLPMEAGEKHFLQSLQAEEKERLFYVITKRDLILKQQDLADVEEFVRQQIADVGLRCDRLIWVSARQVFDAHCKGASDEDLQAVKQQSGLAELEHDLEGYILTHSDKNALVKRNLEAALEGVKACCQSSVIVLDRRIKEFNENIPELEDRLRRVKADSDSVRNKSRRAIQKFAVDWDREVGRFTQRLQHKCDAISNRIAARFSNTGFLEAVRKSFNVAHVVAEEVHAEASDAIYTLEDKLRQRVDALNEELNLEFDAYLSRRVSTDVSGKAANLLGLTGVGAAGAAAASQIAGAWGAVSTAWAAIGAKTIAVEEAARNVGAVQAMWAWLVGSHATTVTTAASQAAAAQSLAVSGAVTATVSGVATCGVAIAGFYVAKLIAHHGLIMFQEHRLPGIVEAAMKQAMQDVTKKLTEDRKDIEQSYSDLIDSHLRDNEESQEAIIDAIQRSDPGMKHRLCEQYDRFQRFMQSAIALHEDLDRLALPGAA